MRPKNAKIQRFHTSAATSFQVSRSAAVGHRTRPLAVFVHDADGVECVEIIVESFHDTTAT